FNLVHESKLMPNKVVEKCGPYLVLTSSMCIATPRQLFIKRCMDIVGSLVGLLITGIAFLIFAPIIKKQSPGPIFFSQTRVGKNGRQFKIYKFRSMYTDAEERKKELMEQNKMQGLMFKMDDDPRIFPIGKFMRKFSIDELPQFWNVLKGDMSLVGTRPPTLDEFAQYEAHHCARLGNKPGLTGMWQVSGRSKITDFEEVVSLDTAYISNWNLAMDVRILFKTVKVVLLGRGAE
ncbi:MAG: sugar transferase, partial [Roseburia sp.]|nr:sugar transferase [Roseburia sp.]